MKYGDVYVLESDEFQLFLPKYYNQVSIEEFVEDRWFSLVDKNLLPNGRLGPIFRFFKRNAGDKPKNAPINPRPDPMLTGNVDQIRNSLS